MRAPTTTRKTNKRQAPKDKNTKRYECRKMMTAATKQVCLVEGKLRDATSTTPKRGREEPIVQCTHTAAGTSHA